MIIRVFFFNFVKYCSEKNKLKFLMLKEQQTNTVCLCFTNISVISPTYLKFIINKQKSYYRLCLKSIRVF